MASAEALTEICTTKEARCGQIDCVVRPSGGRVRLSPEFCMINTSGVTLMYPKRATATAARPQDTGEGTAASRTDV